MTKNKPACPICKTGDHVKKNGKFRGKQRYLCNQCSKSFQLNYSAPVIEDESLIVDNWVKGRKNLSQMAVSNSISNYYLKKMITKRYCSMLNTTEQLTAVLNKERQKAENKKTAYEQQLESEPKYKHGEIQKLKGLISESVLTLDEYIQALEKAKRRLKELEKLKEKPKVIEDLTEIAPAPGSKLMNNTKETINFSKFKKFLRKEL